MSKLILGGVKFYKVERDEWLENALGWSGTRDFKLEGQRRFLLRSE